MKDPAIAIQELVHDRSFPNSFLSSPPALWKYNTKLYCSTLAVCYSCFSVQYLIHLMFFQDNGLWRDSGDPGNGWRVIPVVWKKQNTSQIEEVSLCLLPSANPWCLVSVYGASPSIHPPISVWLPAWLSRLLPHPAPLTLCPALSRTPVISWGRGNRHHGLSCHPSSCTWPLLSPRAPLLQRTTCQRERTDGGQVGETAKEKERKKRTRWLTRGVRQHDSPGFRRWLCEFRG